MAAKLKNLKVRKVDFVDEGANPDSHIRMIKRKDKERQSAEKGSRRGSGDVLKKLFGFIGRAAGMNQDEIDSAMDEIQKGDSVSFSEKINEFNNRKIADEIWDTCYALQSSLCSILNDEEMEDTNAAQAMQESLDEFYSLVKEAIKQWSGGMESGITRKGEGVTEADLAVMKAAAQRLDESIRKASGDTKDNKVLEKDEASSKVDPKGEKEEMKIDKSKMTDAERAFLDSIEKRYGTEGEADISSESIVPASAAAPTGQIAAPSDPTVTKSVAQEGDATVQESQENEADNIYKGLHPAVKAELEGLRKFREKAEEKELCNIAKKYAIIGKKEEELVPMFKSLQAAGGTAYNDMIAVLDQAVDFVEKSGVFSEIGKSGHGFGSIGATEAKIDSIAKGYMEKDSTLGYATALAKAWEDNPELMDEYEEEAGF